MAKKLELKGRLTRSYRKAETGTLVYIYELSGNEESLEAYKAHNEREGLPHNVDEDSGKPLYFSTTSSAQNIRVGFTQAGKPFVDNTETNRLVTAVNNIPAGALQNALAARAADKIFADLMGGTGSSASAGSNGMESEEEEPEEGTVADNKKATPGKV